MGTVDKNLLDIEYTRVGEHPLLLDLHIPANGTQPYPVVVWLFGGGWTRGDRQARPIVRLVDDNLYQHGYAIAAIDYRLSGEVQFPAQVEDCKTAIRFLRKHAEPFELDANRIGVWGFSSGAHLAALVGLTGLTKQFDVGDNLEISSQVQAVCAFAVTSDFRQVNSANSYEDPNDPNSAIAQLFGGPIQEKMELVIQAAPVTYVSPRTPPFLLIHGEKDGVVSCEQSRLLHEALTKAGVESILYIIPDGDHGMAGLDQAKVEHILNITEEFFQKHLRG
jgi:acetyl esterase/lipase